MTNQETAIAKLREAEEMAKDEAWAAGARVFQNETCPACRGTGGGIYNDCATCGGNGVVS